MPELTRRLPAAIVGCWMALLGVSGCTPANMDRPAGRDASKADGPPFATASEPALNFWRRFGNPHQFEIGLYRGLVPMARHAQEIVYGQVTAVRFGPEMWAGGLRLRRVRVEIKVLDAVTDRRLGEGDRATMVIGAVSPGGTTFQRKHDQMVADEGLFFLDRAGSAQPEFGIPADPEYLALGVYRPVTPQGVLINDRGLVRWGQKFGEIGFPLRLEGTPFSDLMEKARAALRRRPR